MKRMAIVTCQCGAKVRLADGTAGRCPRCQSMLSAPQVVPLPVGVGAAVGGSIPPPPPIAPPPLPSRVPSVAPSVAASSSAAGANCPTCQTAIAPGEAAVDCPTCGQPHHRECWDEIGGCA